MSTEPNSTDPLGSDNSPSGGPSSPPPLPPYRTNLTRIVLAGTVVYFAGFAVLLFFMDDLREHDAMIWLWTCLTGAVLGLAGMAVYQWQRSAARRGHRGAQTSALD